MLKDVLRTLRKVRRFEGIIVVTADRSIRRIVKPLRAHFLWEGKRRGLNKGLRLAVQDALAKGSSAVLILPSDIPAITRKDVCRFLKLTDGYPIGITPSNDGRGTNALLLRPPGIIAPAFGKNSFQRHMSKAKRRGLSTKVVKLSSIRTDIDEPRDLARLVRLSLRNETGTYLRALDHRNEIKV